ncbi:methyltransferase domain-containing protein [Xanthobacter sp. VTT E-85241]|uniref:methyltransferase domain-containing protein n=1 Tax=Roseixanthobacter finlandensis TaxID=3119922 RepID=UPI00372BB773
MKMDFCPICGSKKLVNRGSREIAQFLTERCELGEVMTEGLYCQICDFFFFKRRLSSGEAEKLYVGYRDQKYNDLRLRVEPSYAGFIPSFDNKFSPYYIDRAQEYAEVVDIFSEIYPKTVMDFGGDGFFPGRIFPAAEVRIDDLSAGKSGNGLCDFVFASQVMEHVSNPRLTLLQAMEYLSDEGIICVDVPKQYDGLLLSSLDEQEKSGGPLMIMHEHINHFSQRSIRALLRAVNLVPIFEAVLPKYNVILALACRPGSKVASEFLGQKISRECKWALNMIRYSL